MPCVPKQISQADASQIKSALQEGQKEHFSPRQQFTADLHVLFEASLLAGQYTAALRAKELMGKAQGFFDATATAKSKKQTLDLKKMSDTQVEQLIESLSEELDVLEKAQP